MKVSLPLDEMTVTEKLSMMERLWDDLCRRPEDVPSPAWHEETLAAREDRARAGGAKFVPADEMKGRLREATR
jgi:putative addiction module component (TIGR02574 family)